MKRIQIKKREGIKVTGTVRLYSTPAGAIDALILSLLTPEETAHMEAEKLRLAEDFVLTPHYITDQDRRDKIRDYVRSGKLEMEQKNILMQSPNYGLDLIIQQLVGTTTYPLALQYGEIGTGSTSPAITDTALTAPTNRAFVSFQQDYGTTDAIVQFIFSDSQLTNGTYTEFGVFAGGTATIGSGQLFNHALFSSPYAKVAGQDTTVEVDFNFS